MHTTCLTDDPEEAAAYIQQGELAAFPTETVYGLGADATSEAAVLKLFEAKQRPRDNPLIVHLASAPRIEGVMHPIPRHAEVLLSHFSPGPLTVIGPVGRSVASSVTCGLDTVAVRIPSHPVATAFLDACDVPVAAPSANISGRPSTTTWQDVNNDLGGRIACILRGDRSAVGLESTVVDCSKSPPALLRSGAISLEDLQQVLPSITAEVIDSRSSRSPGTRYRHYAPRASVHLVSSGNAPDGETAAYIGVTRPASDNYRLLQICDDLPNYAHELYRFFRAADRAGCTSIFCEIVPPRGLGRALLDRIKRASLGS